mmetsp:Transcript_13862/g.27637  ORF Transcript_13862/g.27637 Transcript_13862/m.27637 type:complete len:282 (-) Transcript_13862:56-901(-)|eukprot:CAMPEP_0182453460 /NCGR_PEP_ID=MMETSP1319-20130603/515_1 /TAXON_ID=172717 /ORGANISM="Bolidomonas pacifica, Strain RCC208" /LENGTH=281 /DNA_ID=CAMNT_0024651395 /DNA_START=177 /DNA_END=1022 /DNA_ORIENTATION=-
MSLTPIPVPPIGFGLYLIAADRTYECVMNALRAGYRHFDSASFYKNEAQAGNAFEAWLRSDPENNKRDDLFIVGKVWTTEIVAGASAVRASFEKSLSDLKIGFFDMFMIHWPVPGHHTGAYLALVDKVGTETRALGVSNYSAADYDELVAGLEEGMPRPACCQMEVSPYMWRATLVDFFKNKGMQVVGYKPLGRGKRLAEDKVKGVAAKCGGTEAQVLIRWVLSKGVEVICKTTSEARMSENLAAQALEFDFSELDGLTTEDMVKEREEHEKKRKEASLKE